MPLSVLAIAQTKLLLFLRNLKYWGEFVNSASVPTHARAASSKSPSHAASRAALRPAVQPPTKHSARFPPGDVEMAKDAAELAGGEQPGNRAPECVQNALARIVHRSAVGIGADGPDFRAVEGRRGDFQHRRRRPSMQAIFAAIARRIPIRNGGRQHLLADVSWPPQAPRSNCTCEESGFPIPAASSRSR